MVWKPDKKLGALVGFFIVCTITGMTIYLRVAAAAQPFGLSSFLTNLLFIGTILICGVFVSRLYGLLTLSYRLDRSQLIIHCGYAQHIIPLASITRVVSSGHLSAYKGFHGVSWPGYLNGHILLEDGSQLITHSTEPFERQVIIMTRQGVFGVSPRETASFISEIQLMLAEGSTRVVEERYEPAPLVALPVWRDKGVWGAVFLSAAINLALWGVVAALYSRLPERLPLQFDPRGRIELVGPKAGLLIVPFIGSMTCILNGLISVLAHRNERFAVVLLLGGSLLVQVICWVATLRIIM
ncbi:MAG: PH domain-containing protein [Chloroflexi bacterium]|nr:PH domain-containing protein [Chloroflexota bacterium]